MEIRPATRTPPPSHGGGLLGLGSSRRWLIVHGKARGRMPGGRVRKPGLDVRSDGSNGLEEYHPGEQSGDLSQSHTTATSIETSFAIALVMGKDDERITSWLGEGLGKISQL